MKKLILIVVLFFIYSNTHALEKEFILSSDQDAGVDNYSFDITPEKFATTNVFIYARGDMSQDSEYIDLNIANNSFIINTDEDDDEFILLYSDINLNFTGSIIESDSLATDDVNFAPWNMSNYYEIKIIIDYEIIEDEIVDGGVAGGVNVNINSEGINKKVFDEVTIVEIYKYEALMMFFIVFYTFLSRIIWRRQKAEKPFF